MSTYTLTGISHPNTPWEEEITLTGTLEDIAKEIFDDYNHHHPGSDTLVDNFPEYDECFYFEPYDETLAPARPDFTEDDIIYMASLAYDLPEKHLHLGKQD